MIRANQVVVMRGENNPAGMQCFRPPLDSLKNNGRGELICEVIEMNHVRLEVLKYFTNLLTCFRGINSLDRIRKLG